VNESSRSDGAVVGRVVVGYQEWAAAVRERGEEARLEGNGSHDNWLKRNQRRRRIRRGG
jgi:hypothetical protein